jgi:hypothetical protein
MTAAFEAFSHQFDTPWICDVRDIPRVPEVYFPRNIASHLFSLYFSSFINIRKSHIFLMKIEVQVNAIPSIDRLNLDNAYHKNK